MVSPEEEREAEMSLVGHLSELRVRLIVSIVALVITTLICLFFAKATVNLLTRPISAVKTDPKKPEELRAEVAPDGVMRIVNLADLVDPDQISLKRMTVVLLPDPAADRLSTVTLKIGHQEMLRYPSPIDPFMVEFKVALLMGLFLSLPILLNQAWKFVSPGLTGKERRVVRPLLVGSVIMFPIGAAFAYYFIRLMLHAMQLYQAENVAPFYDVTKYVSLLVTLMLLFGIVFEMPLFLAIAARIGLIDGKNLGKYRRHAYLILAVIAATLTPPDLFSMIAGLVPMYLLFEVSVIICRVVGRRRDAETADEEKPEVQEIENEK